MYEPFQTYGYTEAQEIDGSSDNRLISTSYHNYASPLIRYDTEDLISDVVYEQDVLKGFKMSSGRSGDVVVDGKGKKINLTALIFGRHHDLFQYAKYIQVRQTDIGSIEIHYVSDAVSEGDAINLFDSKNMDMKISFVKREKPYMTTSGKVNLLIKENKPHEANITIV